MLEVTEILRQAQSLKDDPRILPFGKVLRSSKINELPQLFNVLFGTMSLIGPRPLTEELLIISTYSSAFN